MAAVEVFVASTFSYRRRLSNKPKFSLIGYAALVDGLAFCEASYRRTPTQHPTQLSSFVISTIRSIVMNTANQLLVEFMKKKFRVYFSSNAGKI